MWPLSSVGVTAAAKGTEKAVAQQVENDALLVLALAEPRARKHRLNSDVHRRKNFF